MRDRPLYIGLLCWYLIAVNAWALIHSFQVINDPSVQDKMRAVRLLPASVLDPKYAVDLGMAKYFISLVVPLVTGIFMYEGKNWGRIVYITWGIANYLIDAIVVHNKHDLLPGLPIFACFAILLLLPAPRGYFLLPTHHT